MEPTQIPPIINPQFMKQPTPPHTKRKWLAVILGVVALGVVAVTVFWWPKPKTIREEKIDDLKALEKSSNPVTATVEERGSGLQKLDTSSKPVGTTRAERLKALEALSQ